MLPTDPSALRLREPFSVKRRGMLVCGLKCQEMAFKWHLQLLWLNNFLGEDPPDPLSVNLKPQMLHKFKCISFQINVIAAPVLI